MARSSAAQGFADLAQLVRAEIEQASANLIVLSRFAHASGYAAIREVADEMGLPVLFHIDDDLFELPASAGAERYRRARHPRRIHTLQRAMGDADLIMAATRPLAERLARFAGHGRIGWMENGCAGRPQPRRLKPEGSPVVVGYMGSASHGPDLEQVVPALSAIAERFPDVRLELFGSIASQPVAERLPGSTVRHGVVRGGYADFKRTLASLDWDVGLAPLEPTPYNRCKTPTKWAEYAEAGIAVIASDGRVYGPMIAAGAAMGVRDNAWEEPLRRLVEDAELRRRTLEAADRLLLARYGWERLEASVLSLLTMAAGAR